MKKTIIIVIVILILAGAGYYFYSHKNGGNPYGNGYDTGSYQNSQGQQAGQNTPATATVPSTQTQTNNNPNGPDYTPPGAGGETVAPNIQVSEVDFDGTKFSPDPVNIKAGDYIFFKNGSNVDFWPASAANGGYVGFNSFKNIAPGAEFKFQFTKAGTWPYYDYSHPDVKGTIIVSQ